MNKPKNQLFFWISFNAIAVFLCLILAEGLLKVLRPDLGVSREYESFVSDPYLPYRTRPFATISSRSATGEFSGCYKHNSFGLRDVEHSKVKPGDTFRILGLGDSFTYGIGAEFENTYLYLLEKMLNQKSGSRAKIEIIKAGIPRYYPEPERIFLEHYGIDYHPDLIIVGFLPNDVVDTYFGLEAIQPFDGCLVSSEANKLGAVVNFIGKHSYLGRLLLRKYAALKSRRKLPIYWDDVYKAGGLYEKDWLRLEVEFSKMLKIANSIKAPLVIVHIPQKGPWGEKEFYPSHRLSHWCHANGDYFIDTLPALKQSANHNICYWEKDGHCTAEGYKIIAETIYAELIAQKLIL